jgi:exodeoxyribonuclease III
MSSITNKRKAEEITKSSFDSDNSISVIEVIDLEAAPVLKKPKLTDDKPSAFQPKLTCFFKKSNSDELIPKTKYALGDGKFHLPTIKISAWNINGLKAVMSRGDLVYYINQAKPDVLCLNEIRLNDSALEQLKSLEVFEKLGYYSYYNCCSTKGGYSGTCILSKYKPISVTKGMNVIKHDSEARIITLEFEKFYVICCYAPNLGSDERIQYRITEWDPDFQIFLNSMKSKKHVILGGDLNVAHQPIDWGIEATPDKWMRPWRKNFSTLLSEGYIDTFRHLYPKVIKFSWFSAYTNGRGRGKGSRVDYFMVNKEFIQAIKDSTIDNNAAGSDHCPIELTVNLEAI